MKITTCFLILLLSCNIGLIAQPDSIVAELPRRALVREAGVQYRIQQMWGARIPAYTVNPGHGNQDAGKTEWPKLLAKMAWPATNPSSTTLKSYLAIGKNMVNGSNVGSFNSPFSCAGYAMYYFKWKDSIAAHDPAQVNLIYQDVRNMWHQLMKTDHVFDPCCGYNAAGGKEFNSENFHWMMRAAGYLFAHELHGKTVGGTTLDMTNLNLSTPGVLMHTGQASPLTKTVAPSSVNAIAYFDGFLKNLTRALYNAGRVEWNSNNYFGHTLNPLLTIYEGAEKCNDPNGAANKKRAQAILDWMMLEAALHFVDGAQVAADSRAKTSSFLPFSGSYYQFTNTFFFDDDFQPSFAPTVWKTKDPTEMEVGFLLSTSYRPPQVIIDIAQRKFTMPVEIQSAKPFYHLDHGRYFNHDGTINGEFPYHYWKGTDKGRRFEFETTWIDKNVTMASAAVGRPDGAMGTYSEQCVWRIGFKGQQNGARMLSGNAGSRTVTTGRSPYHEIGQFRNLMMQMIQHPADTANQIWVVVPDSLQQLQTSGEAGFWDVQKYKWQEGNLYLQLRNDVFLAIKPFPQPVAVNRSTTTESAMHTKISFHWAAGQLGTLLFELGSGGKFADFNSFVEASQTGAFQVVDAATVAYTSSDNTQLKMEYVAPGTYDMIPFTYDSPSQNPFSPAGSYPRVWGNHEYLDYQNWDSYRTVFGQDIVNQAWGSGVLNLHAGGVRTCTTIHPETAEVRFTVEKKKSPSLTNPLRTSYPAAPLWTDSLNWSTQVTITDFQLSGETAVDSALVRAFRHLGTTGGVVYFPAGDYQLTDNVKLPSNIVLKGDAPAHSDARNANFAPPSRLVFPKYIPRFEGDGTPNSTAFKSITTPTTVSNCGIVHLGINRGRIALGNNLSERVLVYGVRQNNVAQPDPGVPELSFMNGWQRFSYRHTRNISVYAKRCAAIINCRVNDLTNNELHPIDDDSYDQPGYIINGSFVAKKGADPSTAEDDPGSISSSGRTTMKYGDRIRFNYLDHYGIALSGARMNPALNPVPINQEILLENNWVHTTMRVGYFLEGIGAIARGNIKTDQQGKIGWIHPAGKALNSNNAATFENRGLNFAGENILIENNEFDVQRHRFVSGYSSVDGEGILIQWQDPWGFDTNNPASGANARMYDVTIRNNKINAYIGIYDIVLPISNLRIEGNDLKGIGHVYVFKKERTHRIDQLFIENNINLTGISVGNRVGTDYAMPGSNIYIRNNSFTSGGINFPYQAIVSGNVNPASLTQYPVPQALPLVQLPFHGAYNVSDSATLLLEFSHPVEAIDLSGVYVNDNTTQQKKYLSATVSGKRLLLSNPDGFPGRMSTFTVVVPKGAVKVSGSAIENDSIGWTFRADATEHPTIVPVTDIPGVVVAPNPANGFIRIYGIENQPAFMRIFDLSGKCVHQQEVVGNEPVDVSFLRKGLYLLRINQHTVKFSKQ